MTTTTNFNVSPYFDDYDENKNFHRVLFRPGVPVQARELTQLQTILQKQVERFGDNIYRTGTVIKGCSFNFDDTVKYVKILDTFVDGQETLVSLLANTFVVDSTGLKADVIAVEPGLESQSPDLNTLFIKYLNVGSANGSETKVFSNGSTLTSYRKTYPVESVVVNNGGTLYSNADAVVFTANGGGSGATGSVVTFSNGTIRSIVLTNGGSGYLQAPSVTITSNTGTGANLSAINFVGQVTIANNTFANPSGNSFVATVSEGVIYQKGFFTRVEPQLVVVSKYNNTPSDLVLGFNTAESIVNSSIDTSLLDNATGSPNFQAPGANRLKLSPELVVFTRAEAASNTQFLSLIEFENGKVTRDRSETQFNSINTELSRRTFEESGNYVVRNFPIRSQAITGNTTHLNIVVGAGLGYVQGHRVEILNETQVPIEKASTENADIAQTISTAYGNYVLVNQFAGSFNITRGDRVSLRNAAATQITSSPGGTITAPGSEIGKATIRSIVYDSGVPGTPSAVYRVYLFNIVMNPGSNFKFVRAISSETAGAGVCDLILENSEAVLKDTRFDTLLFPTGATAVKYANNEQYVYRTITSTSFTTGGTLSINLVGSGESWPYTAGANLTNVQKRDFVVVPTVNTFSSNNKTGTVTTTGSSNVVTGSGTLFTTQYVVGQFIRVGTQSPVQITAITNNTSLQTLTIIPATTANVHTIAYPAHVPINLALSPDPSIAIDGTGTIATLTLGHSLTATANVNVYHNVKVIGAGAAPKTKTLVPNLYVKLSTTALANTRGPWCLGIPDVYRVTGVWVGSSNTYSESGPNRVSSFILDNGQRDNYYDLAYLAMKPGASLTLTNNNCLLVRLDAFTHSTGKYLSTESYPVDDTSSVLPVDKIRSQSIPVFVSPATGQAIDLRDVIDFRPLAANTAALANTIVGATIDPATTHSIGSSNKFFPAPDGNFQADIYSYLPRKDLIVLDAYGQLQIIQGNPGINPAAPTAPTGTMTLGTINVPSYPSLAAKEAADAGRPDYAVLITPNQQKGFTMTDIQSIENRLSRLEYYTLLNLIEQSVKNLTIKSSANSSLERFKNGFFVDPFNDYSITDIEDPEYKAMVDTAASVVRPIQDQTVINLKFSPSLSTGVTSKEDYIFPNYSSVASLSQPFASKQRTLVDKYWSFNGNAQAFPSFDNFFDVKARPVSVASNTGSTVSAIGQTTNQTAARTTLSLLRSATPRSFFTTSSRRVAIERTVPTTPTPALSLTQTPATTQNVGDFITDISLSPYIRAQEIKVFVNGLRPGARHYVFFDKQNVTANTRPARIANTAAVINSDSFTITGALNDPLVSSNTGELAFSINLPGNTFFVGEREILVMDFDSYSSLESATSTATTRFVAYSYDVTKANATPPATPNTVSTTTRTALRLIQNRSGGGGGGDPIAQTFRLKPQQGEDGYFATEVEVYFAEKDAEFGVNLEIREVVAGVPTATPIPGSRVWKPASAVNVSTTAATATTFTFKSPVYLKTDTEYAVVVYPDGLSPNYRIWVGKVGGADVANPSLTNNKNWGDGTLFYSTNGSAWTPVQDEDMKFTLKTATFTSSTAAAAFTNDDYEFLTVNTYTGSFSGGELVAQLRPTYANGTVTTSTSDPTVSGNSTIFTGLTVGDTVTLLYGNSPIMANAYFTISGTSVSNSFGSGSLTSTFANGDFVRIANDSVGEIRQVVTVSNNTNLTIDAALSGAASNVRIYKVNASFAVAKVRSISNNTTMTLDRVGRANGVASFQKSVSGVVETYDLETNELILNKSNAANASFVLQAANSTYLGTLVGDVSQARAAVISVDDKTVDGFSPLINRLEMPGTKVSLTVGIRSTSANAVQETNYQFGEKSRVTSQSNILSRTNEILNFSGDKSLRVLTPTATIYSKSAPVIDQSPASLVTYRNLINANTSGETGRYGVAQAKHITKRIVLADGLDAEDAIVYITAYKPVGTDIQVYIKALNASDSDLFDDKDWTLMIQETPAVFSTSLDETDRREYKYIVPLKPPSSVTTGYVSANTTNTTVTGSGTSFNTELTANSLVMLVRTSETFDYNVRRVVSITNATSMVIDTPVSFNITGGTIQLVTQPKALYRNALNSNIVRYHGDDFSVYTTYKYAAIKIVFTSNSSYLVPVVDDIRVLCVSA